MRMRWSSVACVAVLVACGSNPGDVVSEPEGAESQSLEWETFLSMVYQEPGEEIFVVNGDEPVYGAKNLRAFFEQLPKEGTLIVNTSGGVDTKWTAQQAVNLTYCVSTTFNADYDEMVQAMNDAAAAWEAAAAVDFIHLTAEDGDCTRTNPNVLFDVRPVNAFGQYLARAFFPNSSRSGRNILVDGSAFDVSEPLTLTGILRHELGHVLGFRHEHTRPEAGTCFEDNNWRELTPYDSDSVMHYPQCNGTSDFSLELTALDIQGAAALYGAGGNEPPPPPPPSEGIEVTDEFQGDVAQGEEDQYGAFSVVPGSVFSAVMGNGSGDPDLYVRWGAAPTTSSYNCRPYLVGPNEECTLTVPDDVTTAYVMVRGYNQGTYELTVTYVTPDAEPPPPPPPGGEVTEVFEGSVDRREVDEFGPLAVVPGTDFVAAMSGTGDPDLYVRFGAPPTTRSYDCRPYRNGATETCSLTVPDGVSEAYFMVRGYRSGDYAVEVTYTQP